MTPIRVEEDGKRILMERPISEHPDDSYLSIVLGEWGGEFVTWLHNSTLADGKGGYVLGRYFKNLDEAYESYLERT